MAYNDNQDGFQKQKFQGNWKCGKCGAEITELPFEPSPERMDQLLCSNCWREKRQQFGPRRSF